MSTETSLVDELTQSFLEALRTRNFDQCDQKLVFVETIMANDPLGASLALYFKGLLANEETHDAAAAEQFFLQALAMADEPLWRTRILRALGIAYDYQNLSNKSLETFQSLLSIYESLNQPLDVARTLKNIAIACEKGYARGDLGIERVLYGESCCSRAQGILAKWEATSANANSALQWEQSTIQNTLGALYMHMQRWSEALVCYQNHLAYAASSASDAFSAAIAKLNMGEIYQLQGSESWEEAEFYYFEALVDFRQLNEAYEMVGVLANLAALYQQMNKVELAFEYYEQAIALAEQLRARIASESGRSGYFVSLEILYNNAILFYLEQDRVQHAFELTEMARSRAFLDSLAHHSPQLAHDWAEMTLTLPQIQSRLVESDLILAYFCTGLLDTQAEGRQPSTRAKRHRFPQSKIVLFAVTKATIQGYDLALSPNLLRPNHLDNVVERHFLNLPMLHTLYEKLLKPAEKLLLRSAQVFILPHGPLHYVPFSAFITANGQPIVSAFGVTLLFAPSATTLLAKPYKMNDDSTFAIRKEGGKNRKSPQKRNKTKTSRPEVCSARQEQTQRNQVISTKLPEWSQ